MVASTLINDRSLATFNIYICVKIYLIEYILCIIDYHMYLKVSYSLRLLYSIYIR
jgi:hypothetical protein